MLTLPGLQRRSQTRLSSLLIQRVDAGRAAVGCAHLWLELPLLCSAYNVTAGRAAERCAHLWLQLPLLCWAMRRALSWNTWRRPWYSVRERCLRPNLCTKASYSRSPALHTHCLLALHAEALALGRWHGTCQATRPTAAVLWAGSLCMARQ